MNWMPIETPPKKDGVYYVRSLTWETADYSKDYLGVMTWRIDTYSYTVNGGWNTNYWFDGKLNTKNAVTFSPAIKTEWAEVEHETAY